MSIRTTVENLENNWIEACKERDQIKAKLAIAKKALQKILMEGLSGCKCVGSANTQSHLANEALRKLDD